MKTKIATVAVILLVLTGCQTTSGLTAEGEVAYFEAQRASAFQPLFEMQCPDTGCVVSSLRVNNPNDKGVQALATTNPMVETLRIGAGVLSGAIPWITVGNIATTGIRNAGDNISNSNNTSTSSSIADSNNTATTTSTSTTTSTATTSTADSNNITETTSTTTDSSTNDSSTVTNPAVIP